MRYLVDSGDAGIPEELVELTRKLRDEGSVASGALSMPTLKGPKAINLGNVNETARLPEPLELDRWMVQMHTYRGEHAGKLSVLGRLFGGEVSHVSAGVVHEAKRFGLVHSNRFGPVEYGVAVRLSVATTKIGVNVDLNLPNLAAEAQLRSQSVDTRVGISIVGYTGMLGALLPAPSKLDVDTYVTYVNAFEKIQAVVFGEKGAPHLAVSLLSYDEPLEASSK